MASISWINEIKLPGGGLEVLGSFFQTGNTPSLDSEGTPAEG